MKKKKEWEESELIGKTITSAKITGVENCDDYPYLELEFSDGTKTVITASYGGYTGKSEDEYPCYISVGDVVKIESPSVYYNV